MRLLHASWLLLTIGGLLSADPALAKRQKDLPAIPQATTSSEFEALATDIRNGLGTGGRYAYVPEAKERELLKQLDIITEMLAKGDPKSLAEDDKIALFNAQEAANGILTQYDGNRKICQRTMRTGTHRYETICMTYAEQRASQDAAERMVNEANNQNLPKGG